MTEDQILSCIQNKVDFPLRGITPEEFGSSLNELIRLLNKLLDEGRIKHKIYPSNIPPLTILNVRDFCVCR